MKWHIVTPSGHHVSIDVEAVELAAISKAGVAMHQHYVSPADQQISGSSPPGWQALQADVQQLDERTAKIMSNLDRLTASVAGVGNAVGALGEKVSAVAQAVKDHPAANSDDGQLGALADQLDGIASEMGAAAGDLQQTVDTINGSSSSTASAATATSTDTTTAATDTTTTTEQPVQ